MSFKLTAENYYSAERPHVSNSMISDYLLSPGYYYEKHVLKSLSRESSTPSMKLGAFVDSLLTGDLEDDTKYQLKREKTMNKYKRSCTKRDDPDTYAKETVLMQEHDALYAEEQAAIRAQEETLGKEFILTKSMYDMGTAMSMTMASTKVWQENLETADFQVPLEGNIVGVQVCGLSDRIDQLPGGRIRIRDLKTAKYSKMKSARAWHYTCLDMGYYRQAAMYSELAVQMGFVDSVEKVEFQFDVVAHVKGKVCKVAFYSVDWDLRKNAMDAIELALSNIRQGKFEDKEPEVVHLSSFDL